MIRLTFEVAPDPEAPVMWTGRCVELDVVSAAMSPMMALEAIAEAVQMVVTYEIARHGGTAETSPATLAHGVSTRCG